MYEGFKGLQTWQKSYELVLGIYKATKNFPSHEQYGLVSQIRRATVSISGNIAEGYERQHRKEYIQYLSIAKGSLGETETYLLLSKDLGYISGEQYTDLEGKRKQVARLLTGLIRSLAL
jgi:four helix bundle protein